MARREPELRIIIEATPADKVRAIRALVDLYRREMPARCAPGEDSVVPTDAEAGHREDVPVLAAKP